MIDESERIDMRAWAKADDCDSANYRVDVPRLLDALEEAETDLRAARAEIERLKGEADRRVAEEREACAAIAHQVASEWDGEPGNGAALACERRIRARGEP